MTSSRARAFRPWIAAGVCAAAGVGLFQWFGNPTRGYIDTPSLFWWWFSQWLNPGAETQHGPLIVVIAGALLWWNLRRLRNADSGFRNGASSRAGASNPGERSPSLSAAPAPAVIRGAQSGSSGPRSCDGDAAITGRSPSHLSARSDTGHSPSAPHSAVSSTSATPHSALRTPQSPIIAVTAMVAGLAIHALGYLIQQTRISIVGLLLFTWGVLCLGGGARWGRAAMFPVTFVLFAIPVNFLDAAGFHLRLAVIATTEALAHAAGVDVVRNGTQLFAPDGRYQYDVAAACSGVRSLMALLALSLLIGYINLRSPARRLAVFALAFPLTFVGNVVRIAGVVFAGEWFGQRAGEWVHDWAGFIVFVIVLGGVQLAATRLARREAAHQSCHLMGDTSLERPAGECHVISDMMPRRRVAGAAPRVAVWGTLVVVGCAGAVAVFTTRVDARLVPAGAGVALGADGQPAPLPVFIGTEWIGRTSEVTAVEREVLPADTGYARRTYTSTRDRRLQVFLSIVLSGRDRTSIHRPEMCLLGQGWTIESRSRHTFIHPSGGQIPAAVLRLSREVIAPDGTRRRVPALFAYWFVGRDALVTTTSERMWHTAINRLRLRPDRWAYVVAQTLVLPSEDEDAALGRMQDVLDGTLPAFQPAN